MKIIPKLISKSKILRGYQCSKSFYLSVHHKEREPKPEADLLALFDQANMVSDYARAQYLKKYSEAVVVDCKPWDFSGALQKTKEFLNLKSKIICDAAFEYKGCFTRVDFIFYNEHTERWQMTDVRSTTKVKDEHLDDVGLQTWIIVNAGLPVEKISISHINNLCTFPNLENLFIDVDVTTLLRERHSQISIRLNQIFPLLKVDEIPDVDLGLHCMKPMPCVFFNQCFKEKNISADSIFNLPTLNDKKWELYQKRIINLSDERLIHSSELSEQQKIFLNVQKTKKRYLNKAEIKKSLEPWMLPLIFLDFETISYAIPKYEGTHPFQQVPFQFSVHVLRSLDDDSSEHFEFLDFKNFDPRKNLVTTLLDVFKKISAQNFSAPKFLPQKKLTQGFVQGSVVAYYSKFEAGCLQDLMDYFPEYAEDLKQIKDGLVDPLPIFREHVYDPNFLDSFSLKSVAPAILGEAAGYGALDIGDGGAAQRAYLKLMNLKTSEIDKAQIRQNLLQYCKKDTAVLVQLVQWLYASVDSEQTPRP